MAWKLRATGGGLPMVADPVHVREALSLFADPEAGCELMALRSGVHRTLPGSDLDSLCRAASDLPGGSGIYFRVNPVPSNHPRPANNGDILRRRWLYIDVDPVKAAGQEDNPATDAEKERTAVVCATVNEHLAGFGWPEPVVSDSGNGHGIFYPCDLPNDKVTAALLRRLLLDLSARFSGPDGTVDKSVHNANRLAKLPGTWARKGVQSDDRPHRPCKLLTVPAELVPVTSDLLVRATSPEPEKPAEPRPHQSSGDKDRTAAHKFLRLSVTRLALEKPGNRNNALNRTAYTLGGLVAGNLLTAGEVEDALHDTACRIGLHEDPGCGESGIRGTIRRGLEAGQAEPWIPIPGVSGPRPVFGGSFNGQAQHMDSGPDTTVERLTVKMGAVKPLEVQWLMKNRIPMRFITVMAGRTGIGKSYVALDLIARISRGGEIPLTNDEYFPAGGALIISEDSHEYVLAPRLIHAGANLNRVHAMTWKAMSEYTIADTDMLGRACDEIEGGVSVVLIDPPTNFLEGTDSHKDTEVRQLVMRVVEWALARDVAVIFILHVNKNAKGVEALNRVMGSVAWVSTSRIAHTFCKDPDDNKRCLWVPMKNNLGELEKAIAYRVAKEDGVTTVRWEEEVDTDADEAMSGDKPRVRRDIAAAEWLTARFQERPEWESEDLFERARQEGISRSAMFEAKKSLNLPRARRQVKENGDVAFLWWVSPEWLAGQPKPSSSQRTN